MAASRCSSSVRHCVNKPEKFCYICGLFTPFSMRRNLTPAVRSAYQQYFDCKIYEKKTWAPETCWKVCTNNLLAWRSGSRKAMPYKAIRMVWRKPKNHVTDCYFCLSKVAGLTVKTRTMGIYIRSLICLPSYLSLRWSACASATCSMCNDECHKLWFIQMENLRWPEGHWFTDRHAGRLHQILQFPVFVGQSGYCRTLQS